MINSIQKDNLLLKACLLIVTFIMALISTLVGINGYDKLCFLFSFIGYIIMLICVIKTIKNYSSIILIYLAFMLLYTYSGVYGVLWGEGLHNIFTPQYNVAVFLIFSNVAYCALLTGFLLLIKKDTALYLEPNCKEYFGKYSGKFLNRAVVCGFTALFMELINFLRVGGIYAIAAQKTYYSSKVSDLAFTLPGEIFVIVSFIYFSMFLCYKSLSVRKPIYNNKVLLYIIPTFIVLISYIVLGRRGILLTLAIILFVGATYYHPIRKVSVKIIVTILILYFLLSVVYSARAYVGYYLIEQKNIKGLIEITFNKERLVKSLIPYQNEFGVAFGNFNEYYISNSKDIRLGGTYLRSLLLLIPSWLYPGEKPLQIVYEFRNMYFPSEASRGSTASTGFSFLLEAYMNFGVLGIALIYFIIGLLLAKLEKSRARLWNSPLFTAFYLSCFSVICTFQRNSFGDILANLIMHGIIVVLTCYRIRIKSQCQTVKEQL